MTVRTLHQLQEAKRDRQGLATRASKMAMYNNSRWRRASKAHKAEHPLCVECSKLGKVSPAQVTDHIVPHNGSQALFWNQKNWQSLCRDCHHAKSMGER